MKLLGIIIKFSLFIQNVLCAVLPKGCVDLETNKNYEVGQTWNSKARCEIFECKLVPVSNARKTIVPLSVRKVCAQLKSRPGCKFMPEDRKFDFPHCCPFLACNKNGVISVIKSDGLGVTDTSIEGYQITTAPNVTKSKFNISNSKYSNESTNKLNIKFSTKTIRQVVPSRKFSIKPKINRIAKPNKPKPTRKHRKPRSKLTAKPNNRKPKPPGKSRQPKPTAKLNSRNPKPPMKHTNPTPKTTAKPDNRKPKLPGKSRKPKPKPITKPNNRKPKPRSTAKPNNRKPKAPGKPMTPKP